MAKTETAVSVSKLEFLGSTDIQFYQTGKNKAIRNTSHWSQLI